MRRKVGLAARVLSKVNSTAAALYHLVRVEDLSRLGG